MRMLRVATMGAIAMKHALERVLHHPAFLGRSGKVLLRLEVGGQSGAFYDYSYKMEYSFL